MLRTIFATMRAPRCRAIAVGLVAAVIGAASACSGSHAAGVASPPPRAEFLISNDDSSFWVATTSGHVRVRGAPLILARYDNRFYELYTADDDRSYADALLIGERLYRRDIITGDSAMVFSDTTVSHVADIYARTHPDERPLAPDEEGDANPATSATAELDILDVFGPFLSYEYHVDIELPRRTPWHSTRRGVIDLRTGKQSGVGDLIGPARAQSVVASARRDYDLLRDSARARRPNTPEERKGLAELERRQFDPRSFVLENLDGKPAITFAIPGAGQGKAGSVVELEPLTVDSVEWWRDIRPLLAAPDNSDNDRWDGRKYTLIARYDATGQSAALALADSTKHEWPLGSAGAPIRRVDWLDRPPPTDAERTALRKAFDQAAAYDENTRVAAAFPRETTHLSFASSRPFRHALVRRSSERRGRVTSLVRIPRSVTR